MLLLSGMKGRRSRGRRVRGAWLLQEHFERCPELANRLEAAGGLATMVHYGSPAWGRSSVESKVDLLVALREEAILPHPVLACAFSELRWNLAKAEIDGNPFPWWVIASRALWAILEEALRRMPVPLGPAPDDFSPRTLEDVLYDPLSRMGGPRTFLDAASSEYSHSTRKEKLSVLHWMAGAGLSPARLLSLSMSMLDLYTRKHALTEDPAFTAGQGGGLLVDAMLGGRLT